MIVSKIRVLGQKKLKGEGGVERPQPQACLGLHNKHRVRVRGVYRGSYKFPSPSLEKEKLKFSGIQPPQLRLCPSPHPAGPPLGMSKNVKPFPPPPVDKFLHTPSLVFCRNKERLKTRIKVIKRILLKYQVSRIYQIVQKSDHFIFLLN